MDMQKLVFAQREFYNGGKTKDLSFINANLEKLKCLVNNNQSEINAALKADLNKSAYESFLSETSIVLGEINYLQKNLDKLWKTSKKPTPITHFPAKSYTVKEPHGVVLILSPWNYPVQLALAPLAGAIAGGNCAVLKCSKSSGATSHLLAKLINEAFDES